MVIDCLEREEITRIFSDAVDAIMQGDVPTLNLEEIYLQKKRILIILMMKIQMLLIHQMFLR